MIFISHYGIPEMAPGENERSGSHSDGKAVKLS